MPLLSCERFALIGIFALLLLGFALPRAYTQIPNRPPGGFGGRPPGSIGGVPGGIAGTPGGIAGTPGGNGGYAPGSISGTPGGVFGGTPGGMGGGQGSLFDKVWSCSRCGHVLGHGPVEPAVAACPACGAQFTGNTSSNSGLGFSRQQQPARPAGLSGPSEDDSSVSFSWKAASGLKKILIIVGGTIGLVIAIGALCLFVVVAINASSNTSKKKKKRRRRPREYDDDEDLT